MRPVALVALLAACSSPPPPDPATSPTGRLCVRAYSSTVHTLSELTNTANLDLPSQDDYVAKCLELGFTEDQLRCLDPKLAGADDSCAATLEPVAAKQQALDALFGTPEPEPTPAPAPPADPPPDEGSAE